MRFDHPFQHGPESIAQLEAQLQTPDLKPNQVLALATELVGHGHKDAEQALDAMKATFTSPAALAYGEELKNVWTTIRKYYRQEDMDLALQQKLYQRNGHILAKCAGNERVLIVIFTTMYNNFWMSNAALIHMLGSIAGHILILKDSTRCNYFRGVEGFADGFPQIAAGILSAARQLGADKIYVSGFSSGGYAAMLTSLLLPSCSGYLGFSHMVDKSANSHLPQSIHQSEDLKASFDQTWCRDLKDLLKDADWRIPRTLVYGGISEADTAHARHLDGLNTIRTVCVPDAEHNTVLKLLASDEIYHAFKSLVQAA